MGLTAKKVYAVLNRKIKKISGDVSSLGTPLFYAGSVTTADLLPVSPKLGAVYNIEQKSIYGEPGTNVVWNGVLWDALGPTFDLSLLLTKENAKNLYLQKNQGSENSGKFLVVGEDGNVIPSDTQDGGVKTDTTLTKSGEAADAKVVGDKITTLKEELGEQEKEINSVKDLFLDANSKTYYDHASDEILSQFAGNSGQIYVLNDFVETDGKLTDVEINVVSDCNFKLYVFEQYDTLQVSKVKLSNIFDFNLKKGNNRISVNAVIPKKVRFGITGENSTIKYGNIGNGSIHWTVTNVSIWNTIGQTGTINTGGNTGDFSISLFSIKQTRLIKNLKGKTILLFGDSRSSSDYTWYKDLLEEKTGATVLNNGQSGATPKSMIDSGYLDEMLDIPHDICIMFLCGNISGAKSFIGTFSWGSTLNTWGEDVVSRWNGSDSFDTTESSKPIQHVDYIVQKYNKKFFADRKHKLYLLTDIPSKREGEHHNYTILCNYGKSEMIKEVCAQNKVPYIDTMAKCRFNEDFEPSYTPPTDLTTNNGVYYMDGLHLNEYGNDVLTDVIVHDLLDV